tara:strand:- start:651 stop:830 length:180 start_codon:yes stop_codon:yes gene_type:complete
MPISRAQIPQQITGNLRGGRPSKAMRKRVDKKRKKRYKGRRDNISYNVKRALYNRRYYG